MLGKEGQLNVKPIKSACEKLITFLDLPVTSHRFVSLFETIFDEMDRYRLFFPYIPPDYTQMILSETVLADGECNMMCESYYKNVKFRVAAEIRQSKIMDEYKAAGLDIKKPQILDLIKNTIVTGYSERCGIFPYEEYGISYSIRTAFKLQMPPYDPITFRSDFSYGETPSEYDDSISVSALLTFQESDDAETLMDCSFSKKVHVDLAKFDDCINAFNVSQKISNMDLLIYMLLVGNLLFEFEVQVNGGKKLWDFPSLDGIKKSIRATLTNPVQMDNYHKLREASQQLRAELDWREIFHHDEPETKRLKQI